jgi:hypothetical protein
LEKGCTEHTCDQTEESFLTYHQFLSKTLSIDNYNLFLFILYFVLLYFKVIKFNGVKYYQVVGVMWVSCSHSMVMAKMSVFFWFYRITQSSALKQDIETIALPLFSLRISSALTVFLALSISHKVATSSPLLMVTTN